MKTSYIALGGNLDDPLLTFARALKLCDDAGYRVVSLSRAYTSLPWGHTDQSPFLNAVCAVNHDKDVFALLWDLLTFERILGRNRTTENGPRVIDLDLLISGDTIVASDQLTLPHRMMHARPFVLAPMAEIATPVRHPILGKTVCELLSQLPQDPKAPGAIDKEQPLHDIPYAIEPARSSAA